jgi:UDP-N-acetylglucosamine:LPS N-acetylglucosamine transferase
VRADDCGAFQALIDSKEPTLKAPEALVRVLIVSASGYGRGHEALADALVEELGVVEPSADVVVVDGMQSTFRRLNRRGTAAYARQIADDPAGYGRGYELSALPAPARTLGRGIWLVATRALDAEARTHRPDVVVSTHPFMTNALGRMRRHDQLAAPVLVPLHNLDPHPSWMSPGVDLHVANVPEDVPRIERNFRRAYQRADLRLGTATPPVDLRLHSQFSPVQHVAARRRFGLPEDAPVLLVSGGSLDYRLPDDDFQALLDSRPDLHVAVTTGRSDAFATALRSAFPTERFRPIPFTTEMPDLLRTSDGVLLKDTGMTTYEALRAGTPVILYRPLPGQGVAGAEALAGDGYGTLARDRDELVQLVKRLANGDPELTSRTAKGRDLYRQPHSTSQLIVSLGSSS